MLVHNLGLVVQNELQVELITAIHDYVHQTENVVQLQNKSVYIERVEFDGQGVDFQSLFDKNIAD